MQLYLLINQKCNLKCSFCIRGNKTKSSADINIQTLKNILKSNDFSKYTLMITGGEPSLSNLANIIQICNAHFKKICVNTNGIHNSWLKKLKTNNIHIQISIDGNKEIHNKIRGQEKDIFTKINETIKIINNLGIPYNISTTVNKQNFKHIFEFVKEIKSFQKMKYWKISPALPFGCETLKNTISINEWNGLVDFILEEALVPVKIKKLFDFELLDKFIDSGKIKNLNITSNCGDVKSKIYVYPDFTVYPCTCLTDFPLGNLTEQNLEEIIHSEKAKIFSNYKVKENSSCSSCEYLKYCNGGCIGMSWNYFRKLGIGDFRCPFVKK